MRERATAAFCDAGETSLSDAIHGGLHFLAARRDTDGLWRDFRTEAGLSSEWVSGAVIHALRTIPEAGDFVGDASHALIACQRRDGGWGYNEHIPSDADSTAWALRGLVGHRFVQPHRARAALLHLLSHEVGSTGGFATYTPSARISAVIGACDEHATFGWQSAHPCVTANAALAMIEVGTPLCAPALARSLAMLHAVRSADGLWRGYWWRGPMLTTYLALLALGCTGGIGADELEASLEATAGRQNDDGGWGDGTEGEERSYGFATALGLLTLMLSPGSFARERHRAMEWLVRRQMADGSWPTAPVLRIPDGHVVDPAAKGSSYAARPGTNIVAADERRVYTAALVLRALHACRSAGERTRG